MIDNLSCDQAIHLLGATGAWISGIGSILAVVVALHLAKKVERVELQAYVGIRSTVQIHGGNSEEQLHLSITNLGERPVTIKLINWSIGKRKSRKIMLYMTSARSPSNVPITLNYGETGDFLISFSEQPDWIREFATKFVRDASKRNLDSLRLQIQTSVRHMKEIKLERGFLEAIRNVLM